MNKNVGYRTPKCSPPEEQHSHRSLVRITPVISVSIPDISIFSL